MKTHTHTLNAMHPAGALSACSAAASDAVDRIPGRLPLRRLLAKSALALAVAAGVSPAAHAADAIYKFSLADAAGDTFAGTISVNQNLSFVDAIDGYTLTMTGCNGFCSSSFAWPGAGTNASWSYQGLGSKAGTWVISNQLTLALDSTHTIAFNGYFGTATPDVQFFQNNVLVASSQLVNTTPGTRFDGFGGFEFASLAAVPEPQTCALMLAGLAAVGSLAKRRKPA